MRTKSEIEAVRAFATAHVCAAAPPGAREMSCAEKAEGVTAILVRTRKSWDCVVLGCTCGRAHRFAYSGPPGKNAEQLPVDAISPCCGAPRGAYRIERLVVLPSGLQLMANRTIRTGFPMPWPRFGITTGAWCPVGKA